MKSKYRASFKEKGATMVEYAVMVGLIAAVVFVAVTVLGKTTNSLYQEAVDKYPTQS